MKEKRIMRRRAASLALCLTMALSLHTPMSLNVCEPAYAAEEDLLLDNSYEGAPVEEPVTDFMEEDDPTDAADTTEDYTRDYADDNYEGAPVEEPDVTEPPIESPDVTEPPIESPDVTEPPVESPDVTMNPEPTEEPEPTESPEPTEEPEPTESPEPTEEPEEPELVPQTLFDTDAETGTTVFVTGELPVGATVRITPVAVPELMVQVLTLSLTEEEAQARQTIAYDVTLYDADKNVIEPTSPVNVEFKFGAALPIDAAAENFAVIHMEEDAEGGINPVDVNAELAPVTDPAGTATGEVVTSFEVESFSTFVVTWENPSGGNYFTINFNYCTNTADWGALENLQLSQNFGNIDENTTTLFLNGIDGQSQYVPLVFDGLKFKGAYLDQNVNQKVSYMTTGSETVDVGKYYPQLRRQYTVKFYDENDIVIKTYTYVDRNGDTEKTINVDLVYEAATVAPPVQPVAPNIEHHKRAKSNGDGTYDITLDVKGTAEKASGKKKLDVLFILDKSTSMSYGIKETGGTSYSGEQRIKLVRDAVEAFTTELSPEKNPNLDVRYSVVAFSEWNRLGSIGTLVDWTPSGSNITTNVNSMELGGGTNYQGGIHVGISQLQKARSDAERVVIFLTDGNPTYRGLTAATEKGSGQNDNGHSGSGYYNPAPSVAGANKNAAAAEIQGLSCNQFYAIGVGPDFQDGRDGAGNLQALVNEVGKGEGATRPHTAEQHEVTAANSDELAKIFRQIAISNSRFEISNVAISDTLSDYVEPVGEPLRIEVTTPETTYTLINEDAEGGGIKAKLPDSDKYIYAKVVDAQIVDNEVVNGRVQTDFDKDYMLKDGWTYSVTIKVRPTPKAYEDFNGTYPSQGEEDTGTHAGEPGFKSNDGAELDYSYNGSPIYPPKKYPDPVIQLHPGTLVIEKTITGELTDQEKTALVNSLYFDVALNGGTPTQYILSGEPDADGKYTITIDNLAPDTTVLVAEKNYAVPDYDLKATFTTTAADGTQTTKTGDPETTTVTETIAAEKTTTVSVENNYTKTVIPTYTLTIHKELKSFNYKMGSDATFIFEVTGPSGTFTRMMTFSGKDKGVVTIDGLLEGTYTVEEKAVTGYEAESYWESQTLGETNPEGHVYFYNKATDSPYGDSASVKNKVTFVNGQWTVSPDGGVDYN